MNNKSIFTICLGLILFICFTAAAQGPNERLIGKWGIIKVVEIGSWSIKNRDVTENHKFQVEFNDKRLTIIDSEDNEYHGDWQLSKNSEIIYLPTAPQSNYLLFKNTNLEIANISVPGWPIHFEDLEIGKNKLVMYTKKKNSKTKYILTRLH